ncbi:MAG: hypothetical protein Q4C25_05770 [Bacillota bacterium]|nr:hypothetical protein [Bacillota bacterium]
MERKHDIKSILKYAGAFTAWIIGSGFATGQEILQFFSSHGILSYGALCIILPCFVLLATIIMTEGYRHREEPFDHFTFFCGKKLGKFYSCIIPVTLALVMAVLVSASGATVKEYFGINQYLGSAIMAGLVLAVYLIGFENMVKIVSKIGPVIILFIIFVALYTVIYDGDKIGQLKMGDTLPPQLQASGNWAWSAILYLALNFTGGSIYCTALGQSGDKSENVKWGAVLGAIFVVICIMLMNSAILLNAGNASAFSVPTLYLAQKISAWLGTLFSILLILGMFASCCTMMWSFCSRFFRDDPQKNKGMAIVMAVTSLVIGLFPFVKLVSILYPLIGHMGLPFVALTLTKGLRERFRQRKTKERERKHETEGKVKEKVK